MPDPRHSDDVHGAVLLGADLAEYLARRSSAATICGHGIGVPHDQNPAAAMLAQHPACQAARVVRRRHGRRKAQPRRQGRGSQPIAQRR